MRKEIIGRATLFLGDCLQALAALPSFDAVITDPPYGMGADTDSKRFSGGQAEHNRTRGCGRDWEPVIGDDRPFDPAPWIGFDKVVLWGCNHYAQRLPVGTTLVWIKKDDHLFATWLSDAEIGWQKGGHGVYCFRKSFPPPVRIIEYDGIVAAHPTQKPIGLMAWCIERLKRPGVILDPYMGSGTTGIAAVTMGLQFVGVEIHEPYFDVACDRIERAQRQERLFA
jgi:site-specific DNA-methyltransferase (adenine-specific)